MNENNKLRLMAMADHIEYNVKDEEFYMPWWRGENPGCGTVSCAVGHTLHLLPELELVQGSTSGLYQVKNKKTQHCSFQALEEVLGLTMAEVPWLFSPDHYSSGFSLNNHELRLTVARRLRGFAKGELKCPS